MTALKDLEPTRLVEEFEQAVTRQVLQRLGSRQALDAALRDTERLRTELLRRIK